MERIFNKSFRFSVDGYEEWQDQKCISEDDLDAEIFGVVNGYRMYFELFLPAGSELNITTSFSMGLSTGHILKAKDTDLSQGRIQYHNLPVNPSTPFVCQLFCQYGTIEYIRFAFSNSKIPSPSRIYELHGDMIELGELSKESKQKLKNRAAGISVHTISYKQDKYSWVIETASFNPFNVTTKPSLNQSLVMPDLSDVFNHELGRVFVTMHGMGMSYERILETYIFSLIESYYKNAGYVPKAIVDYIIESVYDSVIRTSYADVIGDLENLKYNIYYNLTNR